MLSMLADLVKGLFPQPCSYDDFYHVGDWLVFKKMIPLLCLLLAVLIVALSLLCWWFCFRSSDDLPVFCESDKKLEKYSGKAEIVDESGRLLYSGELVNGLRSGEGKQYASLDEALVYEGDFLDNKYSGQGVLYRDGKPLYEGEFLKGEYSGSGVLWEGSRVLYEGQFAKGLFGGDGTLYKEGAVLYTGGFANGLYEGEGAIYDNNGTVIYTGGFLKGKYHGYGLESTSEGVVVYEGGFKDGAYDGEGTLFASDGERLVFKGHFTAGIPSREGSLYNMRGQLLYTGSIRAGGVDYFGLTGLPLKEIFQRVSELPVVYYGTGYVGYLYQELGFAVISRYVYEQQTADAEEIFMYIDGTPQSPAKSSAAAGQAELPASENDGLAASVILVDRLRLGEAKVLVGGVEMPKESMTGFEVFLESKLEGMTNPAVLQANEALVLKKGERLYEVKNLSTDVPFEGNALYKDGVICFYRTKEVQKGEGPAVVFFEKADFGG